MQWLKEGLGSVYVGMTSVALLAKPLTLNPRQKTPEIFLRTDMNRIDA